MNQNEEQKNIEQNELLDIFELVEILWKGKILVVVIMMAFTMCAVVYALTLSDVYRAVAVLAPVESSQPASPLLSQLGVANGFIGISPTNAGLNTVGIAVATMESREFMRQFIVRHDVKPSLFAGGWDNDTRNSTIDPSIFNIETASWIKDEPSEQQAVNIFSNALSVSRDQSNNLITISMEWVDPVLAQQWVSLYVDDINNQIKQQDLQEANSAISYLQGQLRSTQLVEMQQAFYQLIESQTRIVMLADVRDDYVFRTVDPAYVPELPISPDRTMIAFIGALLGGTIALTVIVLRQSFRRKLKLARS
jgi:uncharacterized protein involved in exopolysaccharide biosynthesis